VGRKMERATAAAEWCVRKQLVDDDVSGLTLKFEFTPAGEPVLRIFGAHLPHGNREVRFSPDGRVRYCATSILGVEQPNWPRSR
jgi:hypothetical protein